jgi:hypothetical protein
MRQEYPIVKDNAEHNRSFETCVSKPYIHISHFLEVLGLSGPGVLVVEFRKRSRAKRMLCFSQGIGGPTADHESSTPCTSGHCKVIINASESFEAFFGHPPFAHSFLSLIKQRSFSHGLSGDILRLLLHSCKSGASLPHQQQTRSYGTSDMG